MDPLLQFLCNRRRRGRPQHEAADWACSLLEKGIESEAILVLAGNPELDSAEQERLIKRAVRDMGHEVLLEKGGLADALQREYIADYYAGKADGETLLRQAVNLYYDYGQRKESEFWLAISEDSGQHGGQGICLTYRSNERPFDEVLEEALTANGFPRSDFNVSSCAAPSPS